MINASTAYKAAIIGDSRRMYIKAKVHIIDPDIQYGNVTGTNMSSLAKPAQLHDDINELENKYINLEPNRWLLDGTFGFKEDVPQDTEIAYECKFTGDGNGSTTTLIRFQFSGVSVLQACSIIFPNNDYDGYPVNFTVQIRKSQLAKATFTFTNNTERNIHITGFSVANPDDIYITITKWSLPYRRARIAEIIVGIHEEWSDDVISEFSVVHQTNFSSTTLPYGTATIVFDNTDRRFDPYNKDGLFASLEEKQGIELFLGVGINGEPDYKKLGVFYQYADGWKIQSGLTIKWTLVDIIGLLADRAYTVPSTLPTTLEGWIADLVGQLGTGFDTMYDIASSKAQTAVTATATSLQKKKCGEILMYLCQASGTWARANPETGALSLYPIASTTGNTMTLENMTVYPSITANEQIARIDFSFPNGTEYSVAGTNTAATALSITNPFIDTAAKADAAAAVIMAAYGGNCIETTGRGDPTDELGDILTVETAHGDIQGRLMYADYKFRNGVLTSCISKMVEVTT